MAHDRITRYVGVAFARHISGVLSATLPLPENLLIPRNPPGSPVFAEEPSNFQKQTTRFNIGADSDILGISGRWTVGRSSAVDAPRPARQHHFRGSIPVYGIGNLLDCCHPPAERSTPLYLARNLERDVWSRTAGSLAGCRCGSAAFVSDQRSLCKRCDRLPDHSCCIVCLPGIKPG